MPELLKIAVPNKGSLSEAAATMLTEAGYGPDAKPVEDERDRDYGDSRWGDPEDEA